METWAGREQTVKACANFARTVKSVRVRYDTSTMRPVRRVRHLPTWGLPGSLGGCKGTVPNILFPGPGKVKLRTYQGTYTLSGRRRSQKRADQGMPCLSRETKRSQNYQQTKAQTGNTKPTKHTHTHTHTNPIPIPKANPRLGLKWKWKSKSKFQSNQRKAPKLKTSRTQNRNLNSSSN